MIFKYIFDNLLKYEIFVITFVAFIDGNVKLEMNIYIYTHYDQIYYWRLFGYLNLVLELSVSNILIRYCNKEYDEPS